MDSLMAPKNEYLLQASLEVLHEQSIDWLSELTFIKEEVGFFNLLLNRISADTFPTLLSTQLDNELTIFKSETLARLYQGIVEHEALLADMMRSDAFDRQEFYRDLHRQLMTEMKQCKATLISIKKKIFSFAKTSI